MPKNKKVFDNISSTIYSGIYKYFDSIGFNLTNRKNANFVLKIEIKKSENIRKLISPDILSYGFHIKLNLICNLYYNSNLLESKEFTFIQLISKPSNAVLTDSFLEFELEKLIDRGAIKMEQYFRSFFLKAK